MDIFLIGLRLVHVAAGAFWVGAASIAAGFLEPAMARLGPDGQRFAEEMMGRRRFPMFVQGSTILTVGAGLILYWRDSSGLQLAWISSPSGLGFTIGGLAAITVFILGPTVMVPKFVKLRDIHARLAAEQRLPSHDEAREMERGQRTMTLWGRVDVGLLGVAIMCMATARYW